MHRRQLLKLLNYYQTSFMEEAAMVERTRRFVMQHDNCFDRSLRHGHVTGSAWVLNPSQDHALLLHHRKLDVWLQPGGHADGDHDIVGVALKETAEESGIDAANIKLIHNQIFDIDVHTVHESDHDGRHTHFDIRFLLEINDRLEIPGNNESHQIGWVALNNVPRFNNARSLFRLVSKTRRMARYGRIECNL